MIKAIIFDFDGVLVESVDLKTKAFAKLFESEGEAIVEQVVKYHLANTGVSRFEKFRYIYKNMLKRELDQATFDLLCVKYAALVVDEVVAAQYVKGADKFLNENFKSVKFFVVSATPQDEIETIIRRRDMSKYFIKIYGAPKAKKDCVFDILKEYSLNPKETAYVGDALSDYDAAISNNIWFIMRINNNEQLFADKKPFARINDLTTLKAAINTL